MREGIFRHEFLIQMINVCFRKWWEEAGESCLTGTDTAMP